MKKEDINFELISKIEIQLDNTLFYMPGETITGKIILNPKYRMKIEDNFFHCSLKIMQYAFWEKTDFNFSIIWTCEMYFCNFLTSILYIINKINLAPT